MIKKSNRKI